MISLNVAMARVKRQRIEEFAHESYIKSEDIFDSIPFLQEFGEEQFLFGIFQSEIRWTAISTNFLFSMVDGAFCRLQIDSETDLLFEFFGYDGVDFTADVQLKDGRKFWFKSADLSSLCLNILLMLKSIPCGTRLKENKTPNK